MGVALWARSLFLIVLRMSENFLDPPLVMPHWLQAKFFDPESQRYRPLAHDYQQHEILTMRSMEECKLVDCVELPLKSIDDFQSVLNIILESGMSLYLDQFVVPIIGDWPCQLYVRQIVYLEGIHKLIPFIGHLHISLNARESILLKFHKVFLISMLFSLELRNLLQKSQSLGVYLSSLKFCMVGGFLSVML